MGMTRARTIAGLRVLHDEASRPELSAMLAEAIRLLGELPHFGVGDLVTHPACKRVAIAAGTGTIVGGSYHYRVETAEGIFVWEDRWLQPAADVTDATSPSPGVDGDVPSTPRPTVRSET
jgi:hypothetical protein